jgi:lipoprotein Spr
MLLFNRIEFTLKWVASLSLVVLLLLTGCKSSRSSVNKGGNGRIVPGREVHFGGASGSSSANGGGIDYSKGITDPVAKALIAEAQSWIGTRYQYGGMSKEGTDCSGFVMSVYRNACHLKIPRTTRDQVKYCTKIVRNKMLPGDLVFFAPGRTEDKVGHVGLYIGDGRMIHASSSRGVMVSGFDSGYWGERYLVGGRVEAAGIKGNGKSGQKADDNKNTPVERNAIGFYDTDIIDDIIDQKIDSIFSSQFFE